MSQSKERALVLFTAKLFIVSQQSDMQCSVSQAGNCHRAKTFLTEEVTLPELLSDNLSDVPVIFLIIARVTAMFLCERKIVRSEKSTVTVKQACKKVTVFWMQGQPRW
jgi:hypothetical protein